MTEHIPGRTGPVCVLVGPPGAGKTTVGTLLADRLGVPFGDTDAMIETVAGKPIPDIFIDDGEEHFRALERSAVAEALAEHRGVVALGGGAVVAEAMVALVLADAAVEKFGGDSLAELRRNAESYRAALVIS